METKDILIGNHHLKQLGGSETYTYALGAELMRLGHNVFYFTFHKGLVSEKMESIGIVFYDLLNKRNTKFFDLALISHQTLFRLNIKASLVVQTCHGMNHPFEQPSIYADRIVAVSERIASRLLEKKYDSILIRNGIDCKRFFPASSINKNLQRVLSLSHSKEVNLILGKVCSQMNLSFELYAKVEEKVVWNIEDKINEADLVVSLGRGACEAMACGRNVFIYDYRPSYKAVGEGMLLFQDQNLIMTHNYSGSYFQKEFTPSQIEEEFKKYNFEQGNLNRNFALRNHDIEKVVQQYLSLPVLSKKEKADKRKRIFKSYLYSLRYNFRAVRFEGYENYYIVLGNKKKKLWNLSIEKLINKGIIKPKYFKYIDFCRFELIQES